MQKIILALLISSSIGHASAASNFVEDYVDAQGGCPRYNPYSNFEGYGKGSAFGDMPFGKTTNDWTDADLDALKEALHYCYIKGDPRFRDAPSQNEEANRIFAEVSRKVKEAQDLRERKERQITAQQDMEQRKIEQQRQALVMQEIQSFYGHIMSDAETNRAKELKQSYPTLAARIEGLLAAQDQLKQKAGEERSQARERAVAAQRIEQERQKQALAANLAEEEAKVEAEKKRSSFEKALPSSCKKSRVLEGEIGSKAMRDKLDRAASLAEAGDSKDACATFTDWPAAGSVDTALS